MKQSEFQKCGSCGNGMAHNGQITFWRVSAERFMLNLKAVQRKHGLEMYFGGGQAGATLANVMGTDEDLAVILFPKRDFLLCEKCASEKSIPFAETIESLAELLSQSP